MKRNEFIKTLALGAGVLAIGSSVEAAPVIVKHFHHDEMVRMLYGAYRTYKARGTEFYILSAINGKPEIGSFAFNSKQERIEAVIAAMKEIPFQWSDMRLAFHHLTKDGDFMLRYNYDDFRNPIFREIKYPGTYADPGMWIEAWLLRDYLQRNNYKIAHNYYAPS